MNPSLPKQKKLIPISEAAKILGVSIDTIRRWDKSGVLHSARPDGKDRYFALDELEKYKSSQPLSISEATKELGISATTLRRLETRGLIKPKRNNAGERVYDEELLKSFLNSDYFLRKKQIKEKILESQHLAGLQLTSKVENDPIEIHHLLAKEKETQVNLKPLQRIPEFLATIVMFLLLVAIGITNISAPVVKSPLTFLFSTKSQAPAVLSQTTEAVHETTTQAQLDPIPLPTAEAKFSPSPIATAEAELDIPPIATAEGTPMRIVTVILEDKSQVANIRQEPSISSRIIGQAENGSSYELISKTTDWYEVKLINGSIGFISAKYIWKDEEKPKNE